MEEHERVEHIEQVLTIQNPDGSFRIVSGTMLSRSSEPLEAGVTERFVSVNTPGQRQTVTTFAPASDRPPTYPPVLPFVPRVTTYVTQHLDTGQPPSARYWLVGDPEPVLAAIVQQSLDAGWERVAQTPRLPATPGEKHILEREGRIRMMYVAHVQDGAAIVELDDLKKWW